MRSRLSRLLAVVTAALALVLLSVLPAAADAGEPLFDPGEDWTLISSREEPSTDPAPECSTASEWVWSSGERELTFLLVPCTDARAASGMYEWLAVEGDVASGVSHDDELVLWAQDRVTRAWIAKGSGDQRDLALLTVTCAGADRDACVEDTQDLAHAALSATPGGAAGSGTPGFSAETIFLALFVPVIIIGAVVAPIRFIGRLTRARYSSSSTSGRYHDVSPMVTKARWRRAIRRTLWWVVVFLVFSAVISLSTGGVSVVWGVLLVVALPLALIFIGYRTFLKVSPVERGRRNVSGQGTEAALGTTLSLLAYALAGLLVLVYVLLSIYGDMSEGWPSLDGGDVRRMGLPLLPGLQSTVQSLGSDATLLGVLLGIPALIAVAMVDGLGQRLRSASLDEALSQDTRPHYLYLRSFDEDKLSLPGQLRGRGLISALAMRRRVRFEEVMVRQLSATGPVIAIAPPGSNMPPIGAARASFSNDEWQQHVHRYAETARAVVLSATPGEIRQGYGWELDLIANRISHQRVLVVLGPWPLSSLRRRWTQFCMAVSAVPFFAPITMPWVPDGIHVLAHSAQRGWQGWGAKRRLDWTYAFAIDQATREYLPDWS